ncbi:MAG: hypothetical protein WC849_02940 [Candidatus Paceibacterota bacterium]
MGSTKYWWHLYARYNVDDRDYDLFYGDFQDFARAMRNLDNLHYRNTFFLANCLMPDGKSISTKGSNPKKIISRIISQFNSKDKYTEEKSKQNIA